MLRNITLGGQSLAAPWRSGTLTWLTIRSAALFAGGWVLYGVCERVAKQQGSLGQY